MEEKMKKFTELHRKRLSIAKNGRKLPEETKRKMSMSMNGIKKGPWTEERKKKASEFYKEWWRQRKLTAYPL